MPNPPTHVADSARGSFFRVPKHYTGWFLLAYYYLAIIWGVRNIYYWEPSPLDTLLPLALFLLLLSWTLVDARRQGTPIPLFSRNWFVIFAWYLIPLYFLWRRGWRGALWVVVNVVLWFALATLTMYVCGRIALGARWG